MYMKRRNFISKPLLRSLVRVSLESSTLMPRRFSTLLDDGDQGGKDGKDSPRRFSTLHQTRDHDNHDPFLRKSRRRRKTWR